MRTALTRWWLDDVRAWVMLKVSGLGKTCHFVVSEKAELEELAELVEEKMLWKTCSEKGLEDVYFGSWLINVVHGFRKDRVRKIQGGVVAFLAESAHPNTPKEKLDCIKLFQD